MIGRPLSGDEVRDSLRSAVALAGGQRAWARQHGLNQSYVAKVIAGRRSPGDRVLAALGLDEMPRSYAPAVEPRS